MNVALLEFAKEIESEFGPIEVEKQPAHDSLRLTRELRDIVISLDRVDQQVYVSSSAPALDEDQASWRAPYGRWGRPILNLEEWIDLTVSDRRERARVQRELSQPVNPDSTEDVRRFLQTNRQVILSFIRHRLAEE